MKAAVAALAVLSALVVFPASAAEELGRLEFPNSGAAEAQESFQRGILLLHSFEYADAREAFQAAQQVDPGFALAYWGEAMTHNHPLWRQQDRDAAREALARLAPTSEARRAMAPTPRERDFLGAVETLYGEGTKLSRDLAYAEAMRRMVETYPQDLESRAFYALSILGTAQGERDYSIYMRAGAEAEEVYRINPEHPGALHYLIHSYDDPVHAPLGLRAARVYAKVAPAASHAQHMISHIYVALGGWDETVDANEKSFRVSEERAKRKGLPLHSRNHHSLHWLQYAYLQQGRYGAARELMTIMDADAESRGSMDDRWYHAMMRAGLGVETREWSALPAAKSTDAIPLSGAAASDFVTGRAALDRDDVEGARAALAQMTARRSFPDAATSDHAGCATPMNNPADTSASRVMEKELEGLIAWKLGRNDEALELLREATVLEDAMSFEFGPPIVVKPSHELFGEQLLASDRAEEALRHFEAALERAPRRTLSLLGKAQAAEKLGLTALARESWGTLAAIWHRADEDLPELQLLAGKLADARRGDGAED